LDAGGSLQTFPVREVDDSWEAFEKAFKGPLKGLSKPFVRPLTSLLKDFRSPLKGFFQGL
jgi:hypothetical protein